MTDAASGGTAIRRDDALALLDPLTEIVIAAGAAILRVDRNTMAVEGKDDGSPVTAADLAADHVIAEGLGRVAPRIEVISEERVPATLSPSCRSFVLIDPLDGTKEFVAGHDEFTVNIALVTDGTPLLGIVGAPALGLIWRGIVGWRAERLTLNGSGRIVTTEPIRTRHAPPADEPYKVAVSRSHCDSRTDAFIDARPGAQRVSLGSAVKFGRLAEGLVDVYPRLSPVSEWDAAAGHAVVVAAGGAVADSRGRPVRYGDRPGDLIVPEFIAWGDPALARG